MEYLQTCLQSLLDQDFRDYELIISDDTPDDTVKDFVQTFLAGRPYRYLKNIPALGSPANWNHAIAQASGRYIKVLHHDDFFTQPDSLRLMVEEIQKQAADFLFCATRVWFPSKNHKRVHRATAAQLARMQSEPGYLFFRNCIGAPSATLYRNDSALHFDERLVWLVDVDFYIRCLGTGKKTTYLDKALICTAHGTENQVTGQVSKDRHIQVREHVLLFDKLAEHNGQPGRYAEFFGYLFRDYSVNNYEALLALAPEAAAQETFFRNVFRHMYHFVFLKRLKRRLYGDKYINFLKLEQF